MAVLREVTKETKQAGRLMNPSWSYEAKSPILAPALIFGSEKKIAFGTKDGRIVCLNNKGERLWEFSVEHKLSKVDLMFVDEESAKSVASMPAYHPQDKLIIFGTETGVLHAIDENGKPQWQFKAKGPIRTTPLIADVNGDGKEEILFGSMDKYLYAINSTGKLIWAFNSDGQIESSPAFYHSRKSNGIVFGTNNGTLYCLGADGKERWNFKTKNPITTTPTCGPIMGNEDFYIAFGAHDKKLYVVSEKGLKEWHFETGGKVLAPVTLADVNTDNRMEVCVGSTDDSLYMLSSNGGKLWQFEANFWIAARPLAADLNNDGKIEIAVGSYDKFVYILSGEGEYILETMPGISNFASDFQNTSGLINKAPGRVESKVIARYKTKGMVTGLSFHEQAGLLVSNSNGMLEALRL